MRCHAFLVCWLLTLSRSLFNVFYICLALDSWNWIEICLDSSSRILESCSLMSLWLFCWWLWASLYSVCQVCREIIFFSFSMFVSFPEVNIILFQLWILLILLSWYLFRSCFVSLSKSRQTEAVSTNLVFLQAWKLISKPVCVFC